jgi:hypothetical protein
VFGGEVLIDLTGDTVKPEHMLKGYTAHGADGQKITGTCTYDSDTQDANAADSEILYGKTAYVKGAKKTGKMPNNGGVNGTISTKSGSFGVAQGYHDGSGKVQISSTEQAKIIPGNIRQGVTILGVQGTMSGSESIKAQSKTFTPDKDGGVVLPDSGYTHLTQVTINPIPYSESDNNAGGKTVTIG